MSKKGKCMAIAGWAFAGGLTGASVLPQYQDFLFWKILVGAFTGVALGITGAGLMAECAGWDLLWNKVILVPRQKNFHKEHEPRQGKEKELAPAKEFPLKVIDYDESVEQDEVQKIDSQ